MFRHHGKNRTYNHNIKLASLLSFVAGLVNITGVLAIKTLTTNVTGHFAYFSEQLFIRNYKLAFLYLAFILAFLLGAFVSNLLIEVTLRLKPNISFIIPMVMEVIILSFVAFWPEPSVLPTFNSQTIGCALLFAMGLQNSLVTKVSQSVVRTTHLTGLFTDLGIELSQLIFYKKREEYLNLKRNINLKIAIISCFFLGCIIGGYLFQYIKFKTLLCAAACVLIALFYDTIRFQYYQLKRKTRSL